MRRAGFNGFMKTRFLIPVLALTAGLCARAQTPGAPPPPPPPGPPPGAGQSPPKQGPGSADERRDHYRKMAEQFRQHRGAGPNSEQRDQLRHRMEEFRKHEQQRSGRGAPQGKPEDRAQHIAEAMKHLRVAGLGEMAERIEEMLKKQQGGHGPTQRPGGPQSQSGPGRRPPMASQPPHFSRPAPMNPGASGNAGRQPGSSGNNDDLREQVQKLARQVEELKNLVQNKAGDHKPRAAQTEPRRGTPDARPQPQREGQPERRPEGEQPKPQGDRERRDAPPEQRRPEGDRPRGDRPESKRDGAAEEIKPAQLPQSDSIE